MLRNRLPFAVVHPQNPLFKAEIRQVQVAQSPSQLKVKTLRWMGITLIVLLGLWVASVYSALQRSNGLNSAYYYRYEVVDASNQILVWLFFISLGANLLLDMRCMVSGLGSISGEISSGRWDLLRLTLLPEEYMVDAKYALAQLRSWRWMTLIVAARFTLAVLLLLHVFVVPILAYDRPFDFGLSGFLSPTALYILSGVAVLIMVFVIEPFWRMRALVALSLAISVRVHSVLSAFLTAFAVIVLIWIVQILIIAAFVWFTISISIAALACSLLIFLTFAAVVWGFYNALRNQSLRHTAAYLTKLN